jgi:hypothetical protein
MPRGATPTKPWFNPEGVEVLLNNGRHGTELIVGCLHHFRQLLVKQDVSGNQPLRGGSPEKLQMQHLDF